MHPETLAAETSSRRLVVAGVMLAVFLAAMESTVVATAMPTVIASLGGIRIYSWVFSAFLLTSTVAMPLWGRLSDLFGRRRTYLVGIFIFLLGSALSGASQNMAQLVIFRALQGVGAGSLITIGYTIIGDLWDLEKRARMQGYFSGVWAFASLSGPLLGGLLTDHLSWRWVFYVNIPFGAMAAVAIAWGLTDAAPRRERRSIDYVGTAIFTAAISLLLFGLVEGGRAASWTAPSVIASLALSPLFLAWFVAVERRTEEPLIPLGLFGNRMVRAAAATGLLAGMAMFGAVPYVPLYVQAVLGGSAVHAGLVLTPFVLGWVICSILSARLVLRIGYRSVVTAGMALLALAFFLLAGLDQSADRLTTVRDVLVAGFGMGMIMVPMLIAVQNAVPKSDLGAATSLTFFFRTIGGTVGVAMMGAVMAHRLQAELGALVSSSQGSLLDGAVRELAARPDLIVNPATRAALSPALLGQGRLALAHALQGVFIVGLAVSIAALASAFMIPRGRARELAAPGAAGD